jgi:hypothetical protein
MTPLAKATLTAEYSTGALEVFAVQYNPTEFSLDKGVQLAEIAIPGLDAPLLQFVRGQTERLSVDLFFDTTDDGTGAGATSVTTRTDPIYSLVKIEPAGHAPPIYPPPPATSAGTHSAASSRAAVRSSRSSAPKGCRSARR